MIHSDFSITYELLNALDAYDQEVGKLNSFFAVHIAGGITTAITLALDTLLHLAASVTKVATGIIATPYCYFTDSRGAENWTWSAAGKHFMQAVKHAAGFLVAPPTAILFSPGAALDLLFPEKVVLRRLQEELDFAQNKFEQEQLSVVDLQSQLEVEQELEQEELSAADLQPKLEKGQKQEQQAIEDLLNQFEEQGLRYSSEIEQLKATLENTKAEVIQLKKQSEVHSQSNDEDGQHIINTLQTTLDDANSTILSLEFQIEDLNVLQKQHQKESQIQIDDLKTQLKKVDEKTFNESQKQIQALRVSSKDDQIRINDLETQLQQVANESVERTETLRCLRNHDETRIEELETQLKQVDEKTTKKSQKQIRALKELNEKDQIQITDLLDQLKVNQIQNKSQQEKVKEYELEIEKSNQYLNELENTREMQYRDLNELENTIEKQYREISQLKLQKQSTIPDQLKKAIDDLDDSLMCPIELDYLLEADFLIPCGHKFNAVILKKHLDKFGNCPECQVDTTQSYTDHKTREIAIKVEAIQVIIKQVMASL